MARANFVKSARKDYPDQGIKKGESYYWWAFRYGGKHYSKTAPKASQLTQSAFYSTVYGIQESISEFSCDNKEDFVSFRDDIVEQISSLIDETQSSLDNMPEQLQESSVHQERIDALEDWKTDIENVECEYDEHDFKGEVDDENQDEEVDDEEKEGLVQQKIQVVVDEAIEALQGCDISI